MKPPSRNPRADADACGPPNARADGSVRRVVEGALRFLEQAAQLDARAEPREFTDRLERLGALARDLRDEADPPADVAETQRAIYALVERCVRDALAGGTTEPVADARDALARRLERWERAPSGAREAA